MKLIIAFTILSFLCFSSSQDLNATTIPVISSTFATESTTSTVATTTRSKIPSSPTTSSPQIITTTASKITPTSAPPEIQTNVYNVTDGKGNICILLKAAIRIKFVYNVFNQTNKTTTNTADLTSVEEGAKVSGDCYDGDQQRLSILFYGGNLNLTFDFERNTTNDVYQLNAVELDFKLVRGRYPFPEAEDYSGKAKLIVKDDSILLGGSYACFSNRDLFPERKEELGLQSFQWQSVQYEAFQNASGSFFANPVTRCSNDAISNLIPIVVGASLAALILIVLIVYLIGRHKSKTGYESV